MMVVAPSARESAEDRASFFVWILLGSVALHAVTMVLLPKKHAVRSPPTPSTIEVIEPPPAPPPPPPPPKAEEAPTAPTRMQHTPIASRPVAAVRATSAPSPSPEPEQSNDGPLDFTGSGSGPDGLVRGTSGAVATPALPTTVTTAAPKPVQPPFVPAASLAKAPSAPGLDAELERNYPAEARRGGISGKAVLRIEVRFDGSIGKVVNVSESHSGFADACAKTVRAARWEAPLDREGRRVSTEITYVCRFEVRS